MSNAPQTLQQLAARAHERELGNALLELFGKFDQWRRGQLDPFELSDLCRQHATETAAGLQARYSGPPENAVAMAVVHGVIPEQDLDVETLAAIGPQVSYLRDKLGGQRS